MKLHPYFDFFINWLDVDFAEKNLTENKVDWLRVIPFVFLHLACVLVCWTGVSVIAVIIAITLYVIRMFAITGFYHRYFSHKTFKTNRFWQFIFACLGASATQRGPLWWAAHHRCHHRYSDQPDDPHSPKQHGFWQSHIGWILASSHFKTPYERVPDLVKFPELRWLNRFDILIPIILILLLFIIGTYLHHYNPALKTTGLQLVVWGYFISTVVLFHATSSINSVAHLWGTRRYNTNDDSRNNFFLALLTLGEGWHNNHHHYPGSIRQGFNWWQIDITYYLLYLLSMVGIIYDLKMVPAEWKNNKNRFL